MTDARTDDHLFRAFQRGDRAAFEALAHRTEPSMLGLARGLLGGDSASACDAVQNAWVRIIRAASSFRGDSSVKTWMYRILVNECRRMKLVTKSTQSKQTDGSEVISERSVLRAHHDSDVSTRLRAAVDDLSHAMREAVLLCCHRGLTQATAAEVLEIPLGTLKTRVRAGLHELRSALSMEVAQ